MKWYKSESTIKPAEEDLTSSKVYNYVRRNIREEQREATIGGEAITMYTYEECKVPKSAWDVFLQNEQNTANIDFMAMELGIDLEV